MKLFISFFLFLFFVLTASFLAKPAYAMTVRGGDAVYVPKDEVVSGTLFAGGDSVAIDGTLHGDLFCGAQTVVISGTVDGDVFCGAQTIRISGPVGGSVRAGGQTVEIEGPVSRNVMAGGQTVTIGPTASVKGEVLAGAQFLNIYGTVTGDISAGAETLTFGDNAKVGGSVWYESTSPAAVAPTATIAGTLTQKVPKPEKEMTPVREMKKVTGGGAVNILWKIIMYIVVAILISVIAPKRTQKILDLMRAKPVPMAVKGFIVLIVVPLIILGLVITIIGIPFAILLGIAYGLILAASRVFAAIWVGEYILAKLRVSKKSNMILNILVGVTVAWVVFTIPAIGGIASFLAVIWGLGAMYESRKAAVSTKRK